MVASACHFRCNSHGDVMFSVTKCFKLLLRSKKCASVIRPLICCSQFTWLGSTHSWCWRKNKIENQYPTRYGRARPFIFAILSGRLIATKAPDNPVRWVRTSILISSVPILLPPVCAAPSRLILKTKRGTSRIFS